ncbi:contactin-associated protein like 5-4 isoform X2 [Nematostella vectensis]|uniref:contactin-associated protein like 5-4 isoform X2 n=1 Tax=Nematostella vectensis TaxID=45351 RepID=UPI0020778E7B|nr:contactin-associated protein like 5-4 isoform X2 [Nematostella vectensis]
MLLHNCRMINYHVANRTCQLLNRGTDHVRMAAKVDWSMRAVECAKPVLCQNTYLFCVGIPDEQSQQCVCSPDYAGRRCEIRCDTPLGMSDYRIPDSSLAASSSWNSKLSPPCGRLRRGWDDKCIGGWHSASPFRVNQFLQVDLGNLTLIRKVATQGRAGDPSQITKQFVTSYGLDYSLDGTNWESYKENGAVKIFPGNSNSDGIVTHTLAERLVTRYVRFMVKTWNGAIVMRVELYGSASCV